MYSKGNGMRTLLFGILVFFVSAITLLPRVIGTFHIPDNFYIFSGLLLMLSGVLAQAEGILQIKKSRGTRKLHGEIEILERELKEAIEKLHSEKKKTTDYRTKLAKAEHRISISETEMREEKEQGAAQIKRLKEALTAEKKRVHSLSEGQSRKTGDRGDQVIRFLSLLQEQGRFLDFVMDRVDQFPDDQVGAAARVVHGGCSQVMEEYFEILPVRQEKEGSDVQLDEHTPTALYRLVGKAGNPPWNGRLLHKGWKAQKVTLPSGIDSEGGKPGSDEMVIVPAQIELS